MTTLAIPFYVALSCFAQESADEIMNKVAANMARGSELRKFYVYTQKLHTRLLRTDKKVSREERREYLVTPKGDETEKELVHFEGQYVKKNQVVTYSTPTDDADGPGEGIDLAMLSFITNHFVENKDSKDGVALGLFPFLPKDIPNYKFTLLKKEDFRGRPIHRIAFAGKSKETPWAGETLIDAEDFHPVSVQNKLTFKMPLAARVMLGTNLRQTGFSLTFTRVAPGIWFPATYGTELRVDLLFAYKRVLTMNMESSDFKKVAADSSITFETPR